jgi:autotransporter-associated beta strand protein
MKNLQIYQGHRFSPASNVVAVVLNWSGHPFDFMIEYVSLARLLAVAALLPLAASAQTLTITDGVQTYASLTNTAVTMSNRCELRVTATNNPIPGCTIDLTSANAWLFLTGVKPSVVVSSYLGQILVSGASAVVDSNVRVVQYGAGAVVIPQAPSFQPLTVFSGPHFSGTSAQYSQYVYYTGTGLGAMDMNISSFKLKRGYMAVMAQNTAGNGFSKCYVAQDGDLDVSVLPATLDNQIRFIYVTPWRWVSKKGIAGNPGISLLNVNSWYDWNIDQTSSRDLEYVAIEQQPFWPGLGQNWQVLGINTLLGYNEPDNSSQDAYKNLTPPGSVSDAVARWPGLLATGLRVGSPATTDGGRSSWLYPFISQADAAGARVDFVAIHYYWAWNPTDPNGAANQMYNFLLDIWNNTHRPIWITEWNNGANWTDNNPYPVPTYAQQQACVAAMVSMLESAPFVERYQLYNWVEDSRAVVTNGVLTAAGVTYRDTASALSYMQALPNNGNRSLAQFLFETNTLDTSGYGNNGLAVGVPAYTAGHTGQAVVLDGTNNYIQLPPNIASSNSFTFAAWVYWDGGASWQRIFDFGNDTSHYLFLTPSSGSGTLRFAINNGSGEQILTNKTALPVGQWQHVAVTLSGSNAKLYTNGVLAASSTSFSILPSNILPTLNYLGKSQFPDPLFRGRLDDVEIADYAFTAAQIAALQTNLPPQFSTNFLAGAPAARSLSYSNSLAGAATDANGGTLTFSKLSGPAWLNVSTGGILTGTPVAGDVGTTFFTVRVTDPAGASAFTVLTITTVYNPAWNVDANGSWSDTNKWLAGLVAGGAGATADFSTLNITADRTVTLDTSFSIGTLIFGDTSGAQNWILAASGGSVLTLDSGSGAPPSIMVINNTATISAPLAGANGFSMAGLGTLILSNTNGLTGTVAIGGGAVKLNFARALENNLVNLACAGSNALKFGSITGASVGALAGINDVWLTNSSLAAVTLTNGNNNASTEFAGSLKGSGGIVKTGTGTLTLSATNAYTGATTISAGTVRFGSGTNFIATLQPVLWMSFDQAGSGIVTNQGRGGWAMNGTLIGSGAYITNAGRFGNALYVNGTGGAVATNIVQIANKVTDTSASSSWTMGYWIKTTTAGAVILHQGDGTWSSSGQTTYLLNGNSGSTAGTKAGAVRWAGGFLTGTTALNDGNWHFITLVDTAGTESIYVDGNVDAVTSSMSLALASGANQTWIGGAPDSDAGAVKMTGFIDEVCVFDRALTQAQIRAIVTNVPVSGKMSSASSVSIASGATLDLSGISQSLASLADATGGGVVTNNSTAPVTLILSNSATATATFSGRITDASAANAISVLKAGNTTQVLGGSNNYRGTTTVNNGALVVDGSLGTNTVTVNGGTLAGNGVIGGPVNIQAGGTLSLGNNAIGALTINNALTINGTNFIELNKTALTNDVILGVSSLTCSGTLTVTNLDGTLAAGDSFRIFYATNYNSSTFAAFNLPPLGVGLAWNTTNLTVNGALSVIATALPQFSSIVQSGDGNFIFSGTGAAGVTYELDAATNLASPVLWFFVTNTVADQNGQFQLSDLSATNYPQRFYRVLSGQ